MIAEMSPTACSGSGTFLKTLFRDPQDKPTLRRTLLCNIDRFFGFKEIFFLFKYVQRNGARLKKLLAIKRLPLKS